VWSRGQCGGDVQNGGAGGDLLEEATRQRLEQPAGNTRSADRSASSIISANTFAKMPEYGMATARMPVVADSPAIWINSKAQNSSCTERRNAHRSRTARSRANT